MLLRRHLLLAAALHGQTPKRIPLGNAASFYCGDDWDKPFLYPLRTVNGRNLSRRHPVESLPGENTDHAWHRGLWYGHGSINGFDFWRELGRDKTARLVLQGQPRASKNAVEAAFAMRPPHGDSIGVIRQRYAVTDQGAIRRIHATIQIEANQKVPLTFGDSDDGGFGFRLSDHFREDRGGRLRNSEGLETTKNVWGKAARWVDYAATIDGSPAGVAVFDHPANLRHPSQWHARGYSLCAANPFASRSFSKNTGPDGAYTLPAGHTLKLQYVVEIYEGVRSPADIEASYLAWAAKELQG